MPRPFRVSLVLTHACNLACSYCYMGDHHAARMPREIARRALDLAFAEGGDVDVAFFGGEPLLEIESLCDIADEARARAPSRVAFQVTTNGTLLDRRRIAALAARNVQIAVSIDGTREAHDLGRRSLRSGSSFDAAVRGARNVVEAGLPLRVISVVTPTNAPMLEASVRALAELAPQRIVLSPDYGAAFTDDDLAHVERGLEAACRLWIERMRAGRPLVIDFLDGKLAAALRRRAPDERCLASRRSIAVAPSGRIYGCERMVRDDRDVSLSIGHVDDEVRRTLPLGPDDPACGSCAERDRCSASCACANLAETGSPSTPGGLQCWWERTTARLADETGRALLVDRDPTFVSWAYGPALRRRRRLAVVMEGT